MANSTSDSGDGRAIARGSRFGQTHWSVVLSAAGKKDPAFSEQSLEQLCRIYWLPIYTFIRRQGESIEDAQDLTQEFFSRLLHQDSLGSVDPGKGRFRSFLLASVKHFLSNQRDRARAQKRGGGRAQMPLDLSDAETRAGFQAADSQTPEKAFEKRWAMTLLEQSLARLRKDYADRGKEGIFEQLKTTLTEGRGAVAYTKLAANLGMTEAAVKMAVHRLKQSYREALRVEIAQTVSHESEVEDELRDVFRALAN